MNKKSSKRTFFWQSTKLELWKLKRLERWTHDKTDLQAAKVEASPETELANLLQPINNSQNKGRSQVEEVTKFYNFNRLHWRLAPPYLKCFRKKYSTAETAHIKNISPNSTENTAIIQSKRPYNYWKASWQNCHNSSLTLETKLRPKTFFRKWWKAYQESNHIFQSRKRI